MIKAALNHEFDRITMRNDSVFGLSIPQFCPDVPTEILDPQRTWPDKDTYLVKANQLAERFNTGLSDFEKTINREMAIDG